MSAKSQQPAEPVIVGKSGKRADADLHAPILARSRGEMLADLAAFGLALADGWTAEDAADLLCGPEAKAELRRRGEL